MMLAVAEVSAIVSASGDVGDRIAVARKIVIGDGDVISPPALMMSRDDVLEFENDSGQLMRLIFVEPQDQIEKIRCKPIDHTIARPDETLWMVFGWGPGRRLAALIPPGKFSSVCALVPGHYAFVATRVSRDLRGADHSLGSKGRITVL
jgi:hypothetical protein